MESYSQPWTVLNKYEQSEPKTYEYYALGVDGKKKHFETEIPTRWEKSEYSGNKWEKPEYLNSWEKTDISGKWEKPEQYGKYETPEYLAKWEKTEISGKWEKPEQYGNGKWEMPQYSGKWEKPEQYGNGKWEMPQYSGKLDKPEQYGNGKWEMPQYSGKWDKPEQYGNGKWEKSEQYGKWEKPEHQYKNLNMESIYGGWEKVCDSLERVHLERPNYESRMESMKPRWRCSGNKCCDEEMVKLVKDLINILIGAEQSYIQLGFLCMDEKFTLVNTSEYFRLCGLRMRWLANGLINKSVRLFNVNEWINNTTFQNWFKVPTKEELATNDYTSIIKTFFKIALDAETRLVEHMNILGDKIMKTDWVNTECRFEGFKWFVNFVLPYQTNFVREMIGQWRNIEMCNNGFIFDKCEMYPLVQKVEEFIHEITKVTMTTGFPVWEKTGLVGGINKRW